MYLIVFFTLIIGICINMYKLPMMYNHYALNTSYAIFSWSGSQQISSSNPLWLAIHLISALFHFILSGYLLLIEEDRLLLKRLHTISHDIFLSIVVINMWRFGELDSMYAIIINGITMIAMIATWHSIWKYKHEIYFAILTLPIVFELISYILL